ncbi:hypothetical protein GAY28_00415, partial [Azospirillum brasilense]|nr:hypothetical protein [Azospirillum brasilense]
MATFFTAETHFGHAKIIRFCKRPFTSRDEMDEALIAAWNGVVSPEDDVWHLGDLAMHTHPRRLREIFDRLNGRKHLITGNHDNGGTMSLPWSSKPIPYAEIELDGQKFVQFHYVMRVWRGLHRGTLHLYGHKGLRQGPLHPGKPSSSPTIYSIDPQVDATSPARSRAPARAGSLDPRLCIGVQFRPGKNTADQWDSALIGAQCGRRSTLSMVTAAKRRTCFAWLRFRRHGCGPAHLARLW